MQSVMQPGILTMANDAKEPGVQKASLADRTSLRLAATLLWVGEMLSLVAGLFHTDRVDPNHHSAAFTDYANSSIWTTAHLGQFVGMLVVITGLLVLFVALNVYVGVPGWLSRLAAVVAVVALALYRVLQAVSGVALKHAVNAWWAAPEAEKAARFASAEALRWLEWGVRSYQSLMLGLAFVLFASVIVWTARVPRLLGSLMELTGLAYMVQGWVIGAEGFSTNNTVPTLLAYLLILVWSSWLLLLAWRQKESGKAPIE